MKTSTAKNVPRIVPKIGIYETGAGTLFVPTQDMRLVHEAAKKEKSIEAIARSAKRAAGQTQGRLHYRAHVPVGLIAYWRKRYRKYEWFEAWLLRGEHTPAHVTVATPGQVERCAKAWDYPRLCHAAKINPQDNYLAWIREKKIPDTQWLKWLFGLPAPQGAYVVPLALCRVRAERTQKAIAKAAGINKNTVAAWAENTPLGKAFANAMKVAAAPGSGVWRESEVRLDGKARRCMWAYAKSATLASCCERAEITVPAYHKMVKSAESESHGVGDLLQQFLNNSDEWRGGKARKCGLVAKNFFVPSPNMLKFRAAASHEASCQRVWGLKDLPGFDKWFSDWSIPSTKLGRHASLPSASPKQNGEGAPKEGGRGRKISKETARVYKRCFQLHRDNPDMKWQIIANKVNGEHGRKAVNDKSAACNFAKRYAANPEKYDSAIGE
jgi:hypothetical protein